MYGIERILGRTITKVETNADHYVFRFTFETGDPIELYVYGDCCSQSWVEHITGAAALVGASIIGVEEKDLGAAPATYQEYDQKYSTILKLSNAQQFEIEYRNSSNGYYGGSIDIEDRPQRFTEQPLIPLTEDF